VVSQVGGDRTADEELLEAREPGFGHVATVGEVSCRAGGWTPPPVLPATPQGEPWPARLRFPRSASRRIGP
jgi:hypothetical protein